jgi:hypothetical protein
VVSIDDPFKVQKHTVLTKRRYTVIPNNVDLKSVPHGVIELRSNSRCSYDIETPLLAKFSITGRQGPDPNTSPVPEGTKREV